MNKSTIKAKKHFEVANPNFFFCHVEIFYLKRKNILFSPLLLLAPYIASLIGSCSINVQRRIFFEHTSRVSCLTKETISSGLLWEEPGSTECLFNCWPEQKTARTKESNNWNSNTLIFIFCVGAFVGFFCLFVGLGFFLSLLHNYLPLIWTAKVPAFCFYHCFRLKHTGMTQERRYKIPN